jgi:phosphonate transport system permease protein
MMANASPDRSVRGSVAAHGAAQRRRMAVWLAVTALLAGLSVWHLELNWTQIVDGLPELGRILGYFIPPAHDGYLDLILWGLVETLAIAFLGTLLAALASIPLGFMGARNIIPAWLFHFLIRRLFDGVRAIDAIIWALIFVGIVGLGPQAGVLAIAFSDTGTLAKLFAEAVENIDEDQVDGVTATGASKVEAIRFAIVPQIAPVFLSHTLYFFESNVRSASILGIVGAGGIGRLLSERIQGNYWEEVAFIIIVVLIAVAVVDTLSKELRTRLVGGPAAA